MAAKEFKLTAERLAELEQELNWLKTVREKEVAELIKEARSFGDLSENSEYDEAKNEVENILAHAVVITDSEVASDTVGLGCTITVKDLELEEEERYEIVGSQEADPAQGRISDDSPFGRAVIGHKAGDVVEVEAPVGMIKFQLIAVER